MENVKISGLDAIIGGKGETLLFLHGFMANKESFIRQLVFFERYYRVVAVDLSGFGVIKDTDRVYTLTTYVEEIRKLIISLGGRVSIIAHSFGGRIAVKLACYYPELVDKLVLVDSAGLKPRRSLKYRFTRIKYFFAKRFYKKEDLEKRYFSDDYNKLSKNMKQSFKLITREYLDKLLQGVKAKTLIVWGKNDKETPLYMAKRYNKRLPFSSLYIIENAGHFCFVDKSKEFNYVVKEFLWEMGL